MDVVLIPAYLRPEYLALCLEYLSKADGARNDKEYWVCQDNRFDDYIRYGIQLRWTKEVIEASPLPVKFITCEPHAYSGNSYNTLQSYKEAYESGARYIFNVEEDVLVTKDFFTWHQAVLEKESAVMCSVAYRCSRNHEARTDITESGAYFISARDYASIGVCWRREHLAKVIKHACHNYYINQEGYILRTFPGNRFNGDFCEQDGLIMRIMWENRWEVVWPYVPRCYHMGWYGYHRPNGRRPDGQLAAKVAAIREQISNGDKLRQSAPDFGDIEPFNDSLNVPFKNLERVEYFK